MIITNANHTCSAGEYSELENLIEQEDGKGVVTYNACYGLTYNIILENLSEVLWVKSIINDNPVPGEFLNKFDKAFSFALGEFVKTLLD